MTCAMVQLIEDGGTSAQVRQEEGQKMRAEAIENKEGKISLHPMTRPPSGGTKKKELRPSQIKRPQTTPKSK